MFVQEDIYNDVVAGIDFATYLLAATDDVLRSEWQSSVAAEAHRLRPLLRNQFFSLAHAEEVLLNLSDHLHGFWGVVDRSPGLLEESHVNRVLVGDHFLQEQRRLCF